MGSGIEDAHEAGDAEYFRKKAEADLAAALERVNALEMLKDEYPDMTEALEKARVRRDAAEAGAAELRARVRRLLDAIGACRRPIVGTLTWNHAWVALQEMARDLDDDVKAGG